jgi:WG containing repeat
MRPSFVLWLLLLASAGCAHVQTVDCSYVARATERNSTASEQQLQPRGPCATVRSDGSLVVQRYHVDDLYFLDGLAEILTPSGWYYVTPSGRTAPVLTVDNGADTFSDGLTRTTRAGKVGFLDHNLSEVIPPAWDFAFPFENGFAVVCQGCQSHAVDAEHSELRGGSWGYINRVGKVIVPIEYTREDLPPSPALR